MNELLEIEVRQAMTTEVIAANTANRFSQLVAFFSERPVHHCPVLNLQGKLVGIISAKDVLREFYRHTLLLGKSVNITELDASVKIEEIMTSDPVTIKSTDKLETAKNILSKGGFQALPVVDDGNLVGILTTQDIIKLKILKIDGADYNPI